MQLRLCPVCGTCEVYVVRAGATHSRLLALYATTSTMLSPGSSATSGDGEGRSAARRPGGNAVAMPLMRHSTRTDALAAVLVRR